MNLLETTRPVNYANLAFIVRATALQTATRSCMITLLFYCCLFGHLKSVAADDNLNQATSSDFVEWRTLATEHPGVFVRLYQGVEPNKSSSVYVVTHGMGGTSSGDRFELLGKLLAKVDPQACVILIDWTKPSQTSQSGFPKNRLPWLVAGRIPLIAKAVASKLRALGVTASQVTFIGESFGNNVNALISAKLGHQSMLLAFNPASELGGGGWLDLTQASRKSYSFHTYSNFDTTSQIAHGDAFLRTSPGLSAFEQHSYGILWMTDRLRDGDFGWLKLTHELPEANAKRFTVIIEANGDRTNFELARFPIADKPELSPETWSSSLEMAQLAVRNVGAK